MKRLAALLLCALLLLSPAGAEGKYVDLPEDHWAYALMDRAADMGILNGLGGGVMAPDSPLTWGHFLTMLSRAFYQEDYRRNAQSLPWDQAGYETASGRGLVYEDDFLPVDRDALSSPIPRQDACALLERVLPPDSEGLTLSEKVLFSPNGPFPDWGWITMPYRSPAVMLKSYGILQGRLDGSFDGEAAITRAEGTALLLRTLDRIEAIGQEEKSITAALTAGRQAAETSTDPLLRRLGENRAKSLLLFGDPTATRFSSQALALAAMTTVEVPVWKLKNGVKTAGTLSFSIHRAIAQDVKDLFTEIFQDPEQFPIYAVEGFRWVAGATGEHNCGTAVDINPEENMQVRNGVTLAGDHWTPGEDPWSIPADGSVVRIFRAHGWSWGGDAWVEYRPNYHDYMHFSYQGR